jgi:hypothetical protein
MDRLSVNGSKLRLRVNPSTEDGPVFICRVPTFRDRYLLRNRVASDGLRFVSDRAMVERARAALETLRPENADGLLETVDRFLALRDDAEATAEEATELRRRVDNVIDVLCRRDTELAAMRADRATYMEMMGAYAFQALVVGAEGEGAPEIVCRDGQVTEQCMSTLPAGTIDLIGQQLVIKLVPTRQEAKNSASPSPSA